MGNLPIVCSVSGGKSSAYIASNYKCDYLVFALVRIEDERCKFKDEKLRKRVEDRIQKPFIGTAEMDKIIYTIFDLEQYIGKKINWVSGDTFEQVIKTKGGMLPSPVKRYCTTNLKIIPMFHWAYENDLIPHQVYLGFRAGEEARAVRMRERAKDDGFIYQKATVQKHKEGRHKGKNKWENFKWQKPEFPLIVDRIYKDEVNNYWENKPVRFAKLNNCVGCFHRNKPLLNKMSKEYPNKFEWFASQERSDRGTWKPKIRYDEIQKANFTLDLDFDDFSGCDTGYCGL